MTRGTSVKTGNIQLKLGELPLWSHLNPAPQLSATSAHIQTLAALGFRGLNFALFVFAAWQFSKSVNSAKPQEILLYGSIGAAALVGLFAARFIKWRPIKDRRELYVYRNSLLTDRRLVAYNHDEEHPIEISNSDIYRAELDYEAGGLVMKIYHRAAAQPIILAGSANFETALSHLNKKPSMT